MLLCLSPRLITAHDLSPAEWQTRLEADWINDERLRADDKLITNVSTGEDAAGGCDGVKTGRWGFHTDKGKDPWWQVDLGEPLPLARVLIWNRCEAKSAAERATNLILRLSLDGKDWQTAYRHPGCVFFGFTDEQPLDVSLIHQTARFVRVQVSGNEFLHLDEVEVFGAADPRQNLALGRPADQASVSQWSSDHRVPKEPDWRKRTAEVLAHCDRLARELSHLGAGKDSDEKASAASGLDDAFSLTPALSPGERGKSTSPVEGFKGRGLSASATSPHPLPARAGRGEGERGDPSLSEFAAGTAIASLTSRLAALSPAESAQPLFLEARRLQRQFVLANPLLDFDAILFTKRVPASFNHMSDQYYGWWSKPGGGIYLLRDFKNGAPRSDCLTGSFSEPGSFLRPTLSYDGTKVLFAWCRYYPNLAKEANKLDKANVPEDAFYHLFEMNIDGTGVRRLTHGKYDDFDGRYLPDGRIVFLSTRRGQFFQTGRQSAGQTLAQEDLPDCYVRCGGGPERPVAVYTLHTMNPDGTDLCAISPFEMFEWTPEVAHDGSILYSRWDYIDRDNMPYMGLWTMSPDGLNARIVYGNYTKAPHCVFEAQPVPNSHKIVFTASGHHSQTMGSLVLLDPRAGTEGTAPVTRLTPEVPFPEIEGWPKTSYANPWPLSERHYLVAWGHEGATVPGPTAWNRWHAVERPKNGMSLYFLEAAGSKELLYSDPEIACGDPIPVRPRPRPAAIAGGAKWDGPNEGRFLLSDVYRGLKTVKHGEIKALRIVTVPPKTHPTMNFPNLGLTADDPGKCVLGTVPVEEDGSAYFRVPAGMILFFQALDARGQAVQTMRSATHVQPGQTLSCAGCHEDRNLAPPSKLALAALREPSKITLGPDGSWPLRFDQLVQPVLDRQCVSCHNPNRENQRAAKFDLTPAKAYDSLVRYGNPSLRDQIMAGYRLGYSIEGEGPASRSALLALIERPGAHEGVKLEADDLDRLITWMDSCAQKAGAFSAQQEQALVALRRECANLLIERHPAKTVAVNPQALIKRTDE